MAIKTIRFDMIEIGSTFRQEAAGLTNDYIKTSSRKARIAIDGGIEFAVKPSTMVKVEVPDPPPPTPEELAERRLRRFENRLWDFTRTHDLETFENNFKTNPLYAFDNCERAIQNAAQREVAAQLTHIFEHQGKGPDAIDAAIRYASQEAMRATRHPKRSTSPTACFVAQELAKAYAEFVEGF